MRRRPQKWERQAEVAKQVSERTASVKTEQSLLFRCIKTTFTTLEYIRKISKAHSKIVLGYESCIALSFHWPQLASFAQIQPPAINSTEQGSIYKEAMDTLYTFLWDIMDREIRRSMIWRPKSCRVAFGEACFEPIKWGSSLATQYWNITNSGFDSQL